MISKLSPVLALASALVLAACTQGEPDKASDKAGAAPAPAGVVNLYTARHYDSDTQIYEAFTKATGIEVRRIEAPAAQLIERIKAEGASSPADLLVIADAGSMGMAADAGLLQPIGNEALLAKAPEHLRDPQGRWFAISRRARVVAYDTTKVKPEEIATYEALATPRFRGKICVRSSDNPYNLSLMAALIERWGPQKAEQWARGVVANMARQPSGGDRDQIRAVGAGQCEVAITNSYYYLRLAETPEDKAGIANVALGWPSLDGRGAHVNVSGAGLVANAPNRANALRFMEFLMSPEAQAVFANVTNEFPVVAGTPLPADVAAYADRPADPLPVSRYAVHQAEAQRIFERAGWR